MIKIMFAQYLMLVVLLVVKESAGTSINAATRDIQSSDDNQEFISREREIANRLLHRLMDVAYDTFKDLGVSEAELKEIQHKRGRITQCYFQAISCY